MNLCVLLHGRHDTKFTIIIMVKYWRGEFKVLSAICNIVIV